MAESSEVRDKLVRLRHANQRYALREHWGRGDWELGWCEWPCTWNALFAITRRLLVCTLLGHHWNDSDFVLSGEPGDTRRCERCDRGEDWPGYEPLG